MPNKHIKYAPAHWASAGRAKARRLCVRYLVIATWKR